MIDENRFNYDSIASRYAAGVDSAPFNALYERPAMLSVFPGVSGRRILDAGCGSGWYSAELASQGATVSAVDSSPAMIGFAARRLETLRPEIRARIDVRVVDLESRLPFPNATFDGAVSALVLHYLPDWRPALREIRRVLVPGGWLVLSTHHPASDAARYDTRNYFVTERIDDHWDWVGDVTFYRRSLTEMSSSARDAGFRIEGIVEPVPTRAMLDAAPDSFERLLKQPEFLILELRREN